MTSTTPLRIGVSLSLTGNPYSLQGNYLREGYALFEQHINARGGLLGRPVELTVIDDESRPQTAAAIYEKMAAENGCDLFLGPYGSEMTEAVADVVERHGKIVVAPTASVSSLLSTSSALIQAVRTTLARL